MGTVMTVEGNNENKAKRGRRSEHVTTVFGPHLLQALKGTNSFVGTRSDLGGPDVTG